MKEQDVPLLLNQVLNSWMEQAPLKKSSPVAKIIVWGKSKEGPALKKYLSGPSWQWNELSKNSKAVMPLSLENGPGWLVRPVLLGADDPPGGHGGLLALNDFVRGRESVGSAIALALDAALEGIELVFLECDDDVVVGALLGLELSAYQFRRVVEGQYPPKTAIKLERDGQPVEKNLKSKAAQLARAVNLSRQLTNLPANVLNPKSYAKGIEELFSDFSTAKVEIWNSDKLKKEGLNLILAVGQGAKEPACLVKIQYRPKRPTKKNQKVFAFVGKGITFDTGGVNIKPDSGMRWMKKDMGGSATVVGLAHWVCSSEYEQSCDFYLALAENAVGSQSFRPGDILKSRSGQSVEIHNTDAEGRLALADAMSVAVETKPQFLVDVATLTGAIKAGLGSQVAGLFGNEDDLVKSLSGAAQEMGDWMWPMPLYRKYKSALKSNVATMVNSGDGFGGAITAALFLENFVGSTPWLHLDIYAWKDSAEGALSETGASGQAVQALVRWLENLITETEVD